jgi:hypothetical protein
MTITARPGISTRQTFRAVWACFGLVSFVPSYCRADSPDEYVTFVKPLLQKRCYSCHGSLKQKAKLRLDTVALMLTGGTSGAVIDRTDASKSRILERVVAENPEDRMPPEHEGERFTAEEIKRLRDWIAGGARGPADERPEADPKDHWAFRVPVRPPVPDIPSKGVINPIDAFLAKQHAARGLIPQPPAPREILVRRLYLGLIGIPPTFAELTALQSDSKPDWYETLVDRLLADRRYGERWGRHWMDVWRYSDWWGLGDQLRNSQKHIWHWRDWIVESLNADLPYDEMIRQMLAADELYPHDLSKLRATGFLARNWFLFNRNPWMEETVEHTGKAFLGLTFNCAKCHDHKYDPISQIDYYRMRAFFEPYSVRTDVLPGEPNLERDGLPRAFDGLTHVPTYRYVRGEESRPDTSAVIAPGIPTFLAFKDLSIRPVPLPKDAWQPERRAWIIDNSLARARDGLRNSEQELKTASVRLMAAQLRHISAVPLTTFLTRDEWEARAQGIVSHAAWEAARAEWRSLELRATVTRAEWDRRDRSDVGPQPLTAEDRRLVRAAVVGEREVAVAQAKRAVAEAELRWLWAGKDKKAAVEKDLLKTRDALKVAVATAASPPKDTDTATSFVGARWTPTRFRTSTADDPAVSFPATSTGRRTALAEWITDPRHPLTARVAVNHIWSRHFGAPLVPTVFDFGRKGTPPAHPELLDWLASELVQRNWGMKPLHRVIVTSAAYRTTSSLAGGDANRRIDPDNVFLWRRVPIRLESQVIRDSVLALSNDLDLTAGGPPVPRDQQATSKRRSLYFFHSNNERNRFLTTFDDATVKECYRRDQSIIPQQALAMTNGSLVYDASERLARILSDDGTRDDLAFVRSAFSLMLGIMATDAEVNASLKAMGQWRKGAPASPKGVDPARVYFVWALFNHNDFVTLR